jgi:hypothetical protein
MQEHRVVVYTGTRLDLHNRWVCICGEVMKSKVCGPWLYKEFADHVAAQPKLPGICHHGNAEAGCWECHVAKAKERDDVKVIHLAEALSFTPEQLFGVTGYEISLSYEVE